MNFIDKADILVKAGDGGHGALSFRHEKFVEKGGPDGGDGGDGGAVVLRASKDERTLAPYRYKKAIRARAGTPGGKNKRRGKNAQDLTNVVPVGTVIADKAGQQLADLAEDGQQCVVASGGRGGFGNAHFTSSTRQAPKFAEKGEPGDELTVTLELKMLADVGLVGLPNAGKSTLLAKVSNARPEIADYPFTTLAPNVGVVDLAGQTSLLFADIPGLIEGAASGKGLGHEFLRHIERTKVLVHLIDAYQEDIASAYQTIQSELATYNPSLASRPQLIALNKTEGLDAHIIAELTTQLHRVTPDSSKVFAISAQSGAGLEPLLKAVAAAWQTQAAEEAEAEAAASDELPVLKLGETGQPWHVEKQGNRFVVTGQRIEKFVSRTDFGNAQAVRRLRDIMRKMGIENELKRQCIEPGDQIKIASHTMIY
jgi:GTP-binding protein